MRRGPLARWQQRGGRTVRLLLTFEDIMEFALALLSASPSELRELGWTFADRKRLLDHFLASGKEAELAAPEQLRTTPIELVVPQRDVDRLLRFARKELPKAITNAAMLDRVLKSLEAGSHRPEVSRQADTVTRAGKPPALGRRR